MAKRTKKIRITQPDQTPKVIMSVAVKGRIHQTRVQRKDVEIRGGYLEIWLQFHDGTAMHIKNGEIDYGAKYPELPDAITGI
jgi:hypothetical protein